MARDRSDRLLADLERGFAALDEGRVDDASSILERCQRIDRSHEGVVQLAAGVADAVGDVETALTHYRALAALHPDDPAPRLCIARLQLHDLAEPDEALATLAGAFDFIDDEDDLVFGVKLRAEAQLALGDVAGAKDSLGELASSVIEDQVLALDLADLALGAEDPATAERFLAIVTDDEYATDARHLRGRAKELRGDHPGAIEDFLAVRAADVAAPLPEWVLSADDIEAIASETFEALPDKIKQHLERVPILIEDLPSEELVKDGVDPRVLGLFSGTPLPEGGDLTPTVTNIHLFTKNLARDAQDADDLVDQIRITVIHETAHYFGLEDEDLDEMGLG